MSNRTDRLFPNEPADKQSHRCDPVPVLEAMQQFPSCIRCFHSHNGNEFIVHQSHGGAVAEQTADRANQVSAAAQQRHGLPESRNDWVIRKHIRYGYIASVHAQSFNQFYGEHFNPYQNFHRLCGVPEWTHRQGQTEASVA